MKRSSVLAAYCLTFLMVTCLVGSLAYGGAKPPSNEPPFGLAISSDATGTKLNGVIAVELKGFGGATYSSMSVQMRLQKGSNVKLFYDPNLTGTFDPTQKAAVQAAVISRFQTNILAAFGLSGTVVLKSVDLEVDSKTQDGVAIPSLFYMADIVLSVQ